MQAIFGLAWATGLRIVPRPTVRPRTAERWVDASNWTKALTDQMCQDLLAAGVTGVVIQAITGADGISYTRQQLEACVRNGLRVAGYVWCFPGASRSSIRSRLAFFDGYAIDFLALDVEQAGLSIADVDRDLAECDAYTGRLTWIYSGGWFFRQQGWLNLTRWANRPLWDSNYTGVPELGSGFRSYGGWEWPTMTQYQGTSSIGLVHEIDLNVGLSAAA